MIVIEDVEMSRNPVGTKENLKIAVTIVTYGYLSVSTHSQLSEYKNRSLTERGVDYNTHGELEKTKYSDLSGKSHKKVKTMDVRNGGSA